MFAVLNRMNDRARDDLGEEPYREIIDLLKQQWEAALQRQDKSSGQLSVEMQVWDNQGLEELVDKALRELDDWLYENGAYPHSGENGIKVAEMWAGEWKEQLAKLANEEPLSIPEPWPQSTLRDALNAAWLCRIRGEPDKVDQVAEAAYKLCEEIIEGRRLADARGPLARQPTSPSARHQVANRRQVG
jgi:ATP/maltotriose-dependent transcriptional regulator MalT